MNVNSVARIASLIGEPARTTMLLQLMDGRALTATELARAAGVSAATTSRHLALLVENGLLQVTALGRHRYHRIAAASVAQLLENIMQVAGVGAAASASSRSGPKDESLRRARTCYDHLAGRLGVAIASRLAQDGAVVFGSEVAWVTDVAAQSLGKLGLRLSDRLETRRDTTRVLCRPCMDWSERRYHLAGRLGALICHECLGHGWLQRKPQTRALEITPPGQLVLRHWLGLELWKAVVA